MKWLRRLWRAFKESVAEGAVRRLGLGAGDVLVVRFPEKLEDEIRQAVARHFDRIKARMKEDFTVLILDGGVEVDVLTAKNRRCP